MNLAFIDHDKEPYTLSSIIAECAEVEHKTVRRLITTHKKELEKFGFLRFQIAKLPEHSRGRPTKDYHLNEQQATLLITFMRNTEPVIKFKSDLVRAFYELKNEVQEFRIQRAVEKPLRVELTDAISKWEHKNEWSYKQITDLMLKHVTGKNAKQLKGDKSHHTALDLLTAEQLEQYQRTEHLVISLLINQVTYDMIKTYLKGV
ncbi:Rha family transcriptional regulator [Aerococcaceae bacterium zg-BR22]|uniref:Rha family transcriptional regulator n=1 Tax=Aerococcaceae bacterium zg-1292 TaxID=2774330 RepID=UPI0040648FD6|nr:Rha family transcriptional regulator [Aerococcaceae bacterium zg-BR22]